MQSIRNILNHRAVLWIAIICGLAARMWVATQGYNFDMNSWFVTADITAHGGNVYAETEYYNYGPVWFWILHVLDLLSGHHHAVLRYLIAVLLSLADIGICLTLCRHASQLAGVLFFLNPVSILITGYHCQFDNLAILMGLWSVRLVGDDFDKPLNRRKFLGLLVLGLSLMTKHDCFAFPFWLAVKQKGWSQKILALCIPVVCFLAGFAPYYLNSDGGIVTHVFCFDPYTRNYFYDAFVPGCIRRHCDSQSLWLALLILFAFVCRMRTCLESLLIYLGLMVALSPVTCNEYLAIPIVFVAVYPSVLLAAYTVASTVNICIQMDGPRWFGNSFNGCLWLVIDILCLAVVWHIWKPHFERLFQRIAREFQFQFGWPK